MVEFDTSKDEFLAQHKGFSLRETVSYPNGGFSYFYDNGSDMVIIDYGICNHDDDTPVFSYMLITDKQNGYMHKFKRLFRFLGYEKQLVDRYLDTDEIVDPTEYAITISDRAEQADVSPLELHFERNFSNVYGLNALKCLSREYGICDEDGNNYFLDYLVRTTEQKYAVEENGISYHHPQIIGEDKYRKQLKKQNTCALWGIKLFRFSTEDCEFDNRIEDDIKQYMGGKSSNFIDNGLKLDRKVELYEHQTISLNEIKKRREAGIKAFLVVLPTASGKSKIVEEDIKEFSKDKPSFKGLILVPGKNTLADWKNRIQTSIPDLMDNIDVHTYAYMAKHYTEKAPNYYSYMAVDEAHHAVAPILKRVIQYYETDFTIGLTATDQRPDKKKLETVFGTYTSSLSLKDAMEKGIVAKANVYRIETNIDLSKVRFNGKDYVNADLEKSIRVTSRNDLIVNVLKDFFAEGEAGRRQGVVFCVNVSHANEMAKLLNDAGLPAFSYTGQTKKPEEIMRKFKNKEIRFLCSCNMISEGWDYPELGILVMARPTLSKVLYLQQIGRGLRKTDQKNNVIVIDVVDEYGALTKACNMHTIFSNPYYVPFGDITKTDYKSGDMITIDGIEERIEKIIEVDLDSFENKYGDYLSQEQVAREYFVSKLKEFCGKEGHELKIITTTYCGITEAKALKRLSELDNTEIKISYNTRIERLHAKSYIFERNSNMSTAYIGSSNLSKSAQSDGLEWNVRMTNVENPQIIKAAIATFERYWNSPDFEDFAIGGIAKFEKELKIASTQDKTTDKDVSFLNIYNILPHQKAIIEKLAAEREQGVKRNLVVAATGTGKTVISAFDYKYISEKLHKDCKLLYIAHREEILKQALHTYRCVLQDANFGELWVGRNRPNNMNHLFVSVDMATSNIQTFKDLGGAYFDYIVFDEAHHIEADSYQRLVKLFDPEYLIGLTATPERMDGKSLLPDFCYRVSAEIRLPKALEAGLLTPFQYFCIG